MKKILIVFIIISSCHSKSSNKINSKHIESLAEDFIRTSVFPKLKDPKPYQIVNAKVITRTVADNINDYRFVYDHLSFTKIDSIENKKQLDSIKKVSIYPDSIINVTVNVAYKTKYKYGDVVMDSIRLGYNREKDKIFLWPF